MALTGLELRTWRDSQKLTQKDVAELLGVRQDSYGRMERGKVAISNRVEKTLRALWAKQEERPDTGASENGHVDPLIAETLTDLPPLAIEPGPQTEGEPEPLSQWQTLEGELTKLLIGANYVYEDFVDGRPVRKTGHIVGLTDLLDGLGWHGDAALIRALASQLAHGYVEWGRHNRRVLGILRMLTAGGAAREALIPTGQLIIGLAMLHGLMPSPKELLAGAWGGGSNGDTPGESSGTPEPESTGS